MVAYTPNRTKFSTTGDRITEMSKPYGNTPEHKPSDAETSDGPSRSKHRGESWGKNLDRRTSLMGLQLAMAKYGDDLAVLPAHAVKQPPTNLFPVRPSQPSLFFYIIIFHIKPYLYLYVQLYLLTFFSADARTTC